MSTYDVIIRQGTVVSASAVQVADIAITDGQIVAIGPALGGTSGTEIDAHGLHLMPGVIDAHVHFNEPGRTEWEGFATGTCALALGGTTTYFDMPLNAHPPTIDGASFDLKCSAAQASSYVDFALWGGLVPGNIERLRELAARGVIGFKAFMSQSGTADFEAVDDLTLYEGMVQAAELGCIVAVHAENDRLTGALAQRARAEGRMGVRDYLASRPIVAELEAISRAILFAAETGCALHIVHVSTGRGVRLVTAARQRSIDVSCETCPHYLVLTEEDMEALGAVAKCAPPLRLSTEQAELWQHLADGSLPMITSDHSPAPHELKTSADFFQVWGGISGCQSLLSLMLTAGYYEHELPLTALADMTSGYIARRFGLPQKGGLRVGADADIVLVDLAGESVLQSGDLAYRHQHSPYVGRTLRGRVVRTLVRGITVSLDGQIVSAPAGRLLRPRRSI
ncbi:MAG: allantoinase [Herpetosiphonaceae bacterium]|nr:allantoinase [Herpetosiphonaceae bacterium]